MNEAERYFLEVAENLSISKAAKNLYVSHQNISQQIQKLEEKYNTQLLIRKPKLALTEAGRDLTDTLKQVRILENQLELRINESKGSFAGRLSIGMPQSRASIIFPEIIQTYRAEYPNVSVKLMERNSRELTKLITDGELDLAFGICYQSSSKLVYEQLLEEEIYVAVPEGLLMEAWGDQYKSKAAKRITGIDIREFEKIPFSSNTLNSSMYGQIEDFLLREQVQLEMKMESGSQETQFLLCRQGVLAFFCTAMHLNDVLHANRNNTGKGKIYVFRINRLDMKNRIGLIYSKMGYFPRYKMLMRDIFADYIKHYPLLDETMVESI